jgi:hypothetical protein
MPQTEDDLPALFRSLRPDNSNLQAIAAGPENEAEGRWPLLKDISLRDAAVTPALTIQERENRSRTPLAGIMGKRKVPLSMPGLSNRMAKSLEKMSDGALPNYLSGLLRDRQGRTKRQRMKSADLTSFLNQLSKNPALT